jgi:hypothetical protein
MGNLVPSRETIWKAAARAPHDSTIRIRKPLGECWNQKTAGKYKFLVAFWI